MTMAPNSMSSDVNLPGSQSAPAPLSASLSEASPSAHDAPAPPSSQRDARAQSYMPGRPSIAASTRNPSHTQMPSVAASRSVFAPLLLAGLAVLGWLGFQTWQFYVERQALQAAYESQQQTVDSSAKLRASLDALAADTQRLADSGNPNARALVDELKKRGVTINSANTAPGKAAPIAPAAR